MGKVGLSKSSKLRTAAGIMHTPPKKPSPLKPPHEIDKIVDDTRHEKAADD